MADDRESYGRIVRETWVNWALEQPDVADHPSWTKPWGKLAVRDREVDMRIGSAVAARAVDDAGLVNERRDAQLFALRCHLPAVLDALRVAAADAEYGARAKRFSAALEALGTQERSDEKEPKP